MKKDLHARRLVPAAAAGSFELTKDMRIYRERPTSVRPGKESVRALWEFLREAGSG